MICHSSSSNDDPPSLDHPEGWEINHANDDLEGVVNSSSADVTESGRREGEACAGVFAATADDHRPYEEIPIIPNAELVVQEDDDHEEIPVAQVVKNVLTKKFVVIWTVVLVVVVALTIGLAVGFVNKSRANDDSKNVEIKAPAELAREWLVAHPMHSTYLKERKDVLLALATLYYSTQGQSHPAGRRLGEKGWDDYYKPKPSCLRPLQLLPSTEYVQC